MLKNDTCVLVICQVKSSLFSSDGRIIKKNDQTPVTVADFGVQALVSLGNYISHLLHISLNFHFLGK